MATINSRKAVAVVLTAGLIAAIAISLLSNHGTTSGPRTGRSQGPDYTPMTLAQEKQSKVIALRDRSVQSMLGRRHHATISALDPWINAGGDRLLGGVVTIRVIPPLRLRRRRLPVHIIPGPYAPPGTPSLERTIRLSASGVSELMAYVLIAPARVAEIEVGGRARVTEERLLGAKLGRAYQRPPGE